MKSFLTLGCALLAGATLMLTSCKSNQAASPYAQQGGQGANPYGSYPTQGAGGQQGGYPYEGDYVDPQPIPSQNDYAPTGGGYANAPNPYASDPAPYQPTAPAYVPPAPAPDYAQPHPTRPVSGAISGTYTVVQGDTLYSIGRRHGTNAESIMDANGLTSTLIRPGEVLNIP